MNKHSNIHVISRRINRSDCAEQAYLDVISCTWGVNRGVTIKKETWLRMLGGRQTSRLDFGGNVARIQGFGIPKILV